MQVLQVAESLIGGGSIEASTLGLKPGEWPKRIEAIGDGRIVQTFAQPLFFTSANGDDNDVAYAEYYEVDTNEPLTVFND